MSVFPGRSRRAVHPCDRTILGLLCLAVVVAMVRWPATGNRLLPLVVLHSCLLVSFSAYAFGLSRFDLARRSRVVRPIVTVALIDLLYTSLGRLGVVAMPSLADGFLREADLWLLGFDPSLAIQPYQPPGLVEFFSFFYAAFIPYSFLSLFLGWTGSPPRERDRFLTGWVFTYALGYLGYLFLPAHGPSGSEPLRGGVFYEVVLLGTELTGGMQGVFPSLHVGGSVYLCLFNLRSDRFRGLTYLPLVVLIYVSTIFLRFHYVVDLVAGTAIALLGWPLSGSALLRWRRSRAKADRPAIEDKDGPALGLFREVEPLLFGAPMALFGFVHQTLPRQALRRLIGGAKATANGPPSPGMGLRDGTSFLLVTPALVAAFWFLPPSWAVVYAVGLAYSAFYTPLYADRLRTACGRAAPIWMRGGSR